MTTDAAQLVAELIFQGISRKEIAESLHRDPRMVSKILRGETSGAVYERTLRDLAEKGYSDYVPPRRRTKHGKPVRIRAAAGKASVEPPADDMGGEYKRPAARTRYSSQTSFGEDGLRFHDITLPKSPRTPGRQKGEAEIMKRLRNAARGQRFGDRDLKFSVTLKSGQEVTLGAKGGYHSSQVLKLITARDRQIAAGAPADAFGKGALGFLADQLVNEAGSPLPRALKPTDITGVQISVYKSAVTRARNRADK